MRFNSDWVMENDAVYAPVAEPFVADRIYRKGSYLQLENSVSTVNHNYIERILIKPRTAWGGAGIVVTTSQEFASHMLKDGIEYVCEEFIESQQGILGVVVGRHDLRLYVHDGLVSVAEIRQPQGDGLLANVALDGSLFEVELERVPQWALDMVPIVAKYFSAYGPRIYTIDMLYGNGRPYVGELNEKPGMPWREWSYFEKMMQSTVATLTS